MVATAYCLWKKILSQQRTKDFKILQNVYFAYDAGIISSYSNGCNGFVTFMHGFEGLNSIRFETQNTRNAKILLMEKSTTKTLHKEETPSFKKFVKNDDANVNVCYFL